MLGAVQCFFKVSTLHFLELTLRSLTSHCMATNPFNQRTSICCEVGHASRSLQESPPDSGGLKGQVALGDAHPYLVPLG